MSPTLLPPQRPTRFCGIDVAKDNHVACVMDRDGAFIIRSQSFANHAEGYRHLLARLAEAGGPGQILVGMEATGYYWYALRDFLVQQGYPVAVLNPIQTKQEARKDIRKRKTDKIDARHIATVIKNGGHKPSLVPDDRAMTCRLLTRLRYRTVGTISRLKLLLWSRLGPLWPEYETLFRSPFCNTSRRLLQTAPAPDDVLSLDRQALSELVRKTSRGRYGPEQAERIRRSAACTVGTRRGQEGARIGIRSLIAQIEALTPIRRQLDADIEPLAEQLPGYVLTLPGISPFLAVSLWGETDPMSAFPSSTQLVAFAGLDLNVFRTGQCTGENLTRHITKRGSPFLRHTLWTMAHRACYQEGNLREYWLRKKREGLQNLAAVTATAIKLCHVVWRILTDRRDYLRQRPAAKDEES